MERATGCDLGDVPARETKTYSDRVVADSPLILGREASACSTDYVEVLAAPLSTAPQVQPHISRSLRLLDMGLALSLLLFVLPLMILCALAVGMSGGGPMIFRQVRIGRGGRQFTCFKFRTMIQSAEPALDSILVDGSPLQEEWAAIHKLRADPRLTPVGRFMRRYSLDELPQLFNVLKGDMSVVGPRPIVAAEIHRYGDFYSAYCSVNPGITGLWQVSGRHALSYDERVRLDSEYAQNKSIALDLLILWKTFPVVFFGQNE